jgi:hypothetical protein
MKRFGLFLGLMFSAFNSYGLSLNRLREVVGTIDADLQKNEILYSGSIAFTRLNELADEIFALNAPWDEKMLYEKVPLVEFLLFSFKIYDYFDLVDVSMVDKVKRLKNLFAQIFEGYDTPAGYQTRRDLLLFIKASLQQVGRPEPVLAPGGVIVDDAEDAPQDKMFKEMMRIRANLRDAGRIDAKASENLTIAQAVVKYNLGPDETRQLQASVEDLKDKNSHLVKAIIRGPLGTSSNLVKAQVYFAVQQGGATPSIAWKAFLNSGEAEPVVVEPVKPPVEAPKGEKVEIAADDEKLIAQAIAKYGLTGHEKSKLRETIELGLGSPDNYYNEAVLSQFNDPKNPLRDSPLTKARLYFMIQKGVLATTRELDAFLNLGEAGPVVEPVKPPVIVVEKPEVKEAGPKALDKEVIAQAVAKYGLTDKQIEMFENNIKHLKNKKSYLFKTLANKEDADLLIATPLTKAQLYFIVQQGLLDPTPEIEALLKSGVSGPVVVAPVKPPVEAPVEELKGPDDTKELDEEIIKHASEKYGLSNGEEILFKAGVKRLKNGKNPGYFQKLVNDNLDPSGASPLTKAQFYFMTRQGLLIPNAAWEKFLNLGEAGLDVVEPVKPPVEAPKVEEPKGVYSFEDYTKIEIGAVMSDEIKNYLIKQLKDGGYQNVAVVENLLKRLGNPYRYLEEHVWKDKQKELNKSFRVEA